MEDALRQSAPRPTEHVRLRPLLETATSRGYSTRMRDGVRVAGA